MSLKLDLTVAAIAEDNGRFLFVQERAARRVVLNQPAGHLETGESLDRGGRCARRARRPAANSRRKR